MSGHPGRSFRWSLKRNPARWSAERTSNSGLVSRERIDRIIRERAAETGPGTDLEGLSIDCGEQLKSDAEPSHGMARWLGLER